MGLWNCHCITKNSYNYGWDIFFWIGLTQNPLSTYLVSRVNLKTCGKKDLNKTPQQNIRVYLPGQRDKSVSICSSLTFGMITKYTKSLIPLKNEAVAHY